MIGISNTDKDLALNAMYGDKSFTLGLFSGEDEIEDANYARVSVMFGEPLGDDLRYVENTNEARFPALADEHDVDHWGIFDAAGELRARMRLRNARTVPANDRANFEPGALQIGLP